MTSRMSAPSKLSTTASSVSTAPFGAGDSCARQRTTCVSKTIARLAPPTPPTRPPPLPPPGPSLGPLPSPRVLPIVALVRRLLTSRLLANLPQAPLQAQDILADPRFVGLAPHARPRLPPRLLLGCLPGLCGARP